MVRYIFLTTLGKHSPRTGFYIFLSSKLASLSTNTASVLANTPNNEKHKGHFMILGLGIDTVEIGRFNKWHTYSKETLLRTLSAPEIDYCLSVPEKSSERFAARFALREAFFKAYSAMLPSHTIPFLTLCTKISLNSTGGLPTLIIDWTDLLDKSFPIPQALCSLTHSKNSATAIVILQVV